MPIPREEIGQMIRRGPEADLFHAERAHSLLMRIIAHQREITQRGFQNLFGTLERALLTELIMALSRLYDNPSPQYPTRCIKGVLRFLSSNSRDLPVPTEFHQLGLALLNAGLDEARMIDLARNDPPNFASELASHYEDLIDSDAISEPLDRLRSVRDKRVAHNEAVQEIPLPVLQDWQELMEKAKFFIGVLGWAYMNMAYLFNGNEYILSGDARKASHALDRLIGELSD